MTEPKVEDTAAAFPEEAAKHAKAEVTVAPEPKPQAVTLRDTEATSFLDPNLYTQLKGLANDFIKSNAIPSVWETPEQVLVGLQTGVEMGMKPMEAMNSLYPVNGAINVWGKATIRRLLEHGYKIEYKDQSQEGVTATVSKGDESYTETFLFADAEASGYTTQYNRQTRQRELKVGWKPGMNRIKKLRYGVISLIISTYIPNVLGSAMGIVEVSDDYDLGTNQNPAQLDDNTDTAKRIAAAAKPQNEG